MVRRTYIAAASLRSAGLELGVRSRRQPADQARTESLVKQAVERYAAGLAAAQLPTAPDVAPGTTVVPLTLEDAVRRAIDNNLEMAVERLNPQTFDFSLAALRADYKPVATSQFGRQRQRPAADEPAEPRQPERVDDDLQRRASRRTSSGAAATCR